MIDMSKSKKVDEIYVKIKFKDLETEFSGEFDNIWKLLNKYLNEVKKQFTTQTHILSVKGKSIPEILINLRNQGFFDQGRTSSEIFRKMEAHGKTNITKNAISMALKKLTEDGELIRKKEGNKFLYFSSYVNEY